MAVYSPTCLGASSVSASGDLTSTSNVALCERLAFLVSLTLISCVYIEVGVLAKAWPGIDAYYGAFVVESISIAIPVSHLPEISLIDQTRLSSPRQAVGTGTSPSAYALTLKGRPKFNCMLSVAPSW